MNKTYMIILGMMIVTYLPRLLPFILMNDNKIPEKLEEFLSYIPYAALGALIIPGFVTAIPGYTFASISGIIVAALIGYYKGGVVLPVVGAILASMTFISIGP